MNRLSDRRPSIASHRKPFKSPILPLVIAFSTVMTAGPTVFGEGCCIAPREPPCIPVLQPATCIQIGGTVMPNFCASCTGVCGQLPLNCPDDRDVCNGFETCDPQLGCVHRTPLNCPDDRDACNGVEFCDPQLGCVETLTPNCDDGNPCTDNECDPQSGCVFPINIHCINDGNACNGVERCDPQSGCVLPIIPLCLDDGDLCNGDETCDPQSGRCVSGPPPVCDDGNPCTDDPCSNNHCEHVNNDKALCDDRNPCTNDFCKGGTCTGILRTCSDFDDCTLDTCDPQSGRCVSGPPLDCRDDEDLCNGAETCDPQLGCVHRTPLNCPDDRNVCNGVETCDPKSGCVPGTPLDCDDGNPCTDDTCVPATGCRHVNNDNLCDDGNACPTIGTCSGGVCVIGAPRPCDDDNPCTDDFCLNFFCVHLDSSNLLPCNDRDFCTIHDKCINGTCTGVTNPCSDNNDCTQDHGCFSGSCHHSDEPFGTECDAGNPCFDFCSGGTCHRSEQTCDDHDPCTLNKCWQSLANLGCVFIPDPNCDGNLDLDDFKDFIDQLTGPGGGFYEAGMESDTTNPGDDSVAAPCAPFDMLCDGDVDLEDFAVFQVAFTGPGP